MLGERVFCGAKVPEKWLQIGLITCWNYLDLSRGVSALSQWQHDGCMPFIRPIIEPAASANVGRAGEAIAAAFLQARGYTILGKNIRVGKDEVDIIALDPKDDVIVFVEVKTRTAKKEDFPAAMAATRQKRSCMLRAARRWAAEREYEGGYRLDVISVESGQVTGHLIEVNA